jgi:hypothetical protein
MKKNTQRGILINTFLLLSLISVTLNAKTKTIILSNFTLEGGKQCLNKRFHLTNSSAYATVQSSDSINFYYNTVPSKNQAYQQTVAKDGIHSGYYLVAKSDTLDTKAEHMVSVCRNTKSRDKKITGSLKVIQNIVEPIEKITELLIIEGDKLENEFKPRFKKYNGNRYISTDNSAKEFINAKVNHKLLIEGKVFGSSDRDFIMIKLPDENVNVKVRMHTTESSHVSYFTGNVNSNNPSDAELAKSFRTIKANKHYAGVVEGTYKANSYIYIIADAHFAPHVGYKAYVTITKLPQTRSRTFSPIVFKDDGVKTSAPIIQEVLKSLAPKPTTTVSKPTTSQPSSSKADENDGSIANATPIAANRGTIYGYANSYADRDVYKIHLQKGDRAVFYTTPHGINPTRTTMNGNLIMPNKYQKNPRSVSHKEAGKYHVNGFIVEANDIPYTGWYYLQLVATGSGAYKINYFAKPSNEELARQAAKKAAKIKNTNITIKEGHGYLSINKPTSWVYKDVNTYFTFTLPKDAKLTLQATFDRADSKLKVQLLDSKNKLVKNGQVHNYSNFKGTGISTNIDLKAGTYKILANTPHRRSWLALTGSYKVTKVNSSAASTLTQGQKAAIEIIQKD